jgi:aspartate/methionine/tyrosine aminotransferase
MTVSRLRDIPGIGVDGIGDRADRLGDPDMLRLENLDTDLRPPPAAVAATLEAASRDDANSYLPFQGSWRLREAVVAHVAKVSGVQYDPASECVITAGGLNGVFNALLATVEPGDEVVLLDPIYAGLVNRVRLAGGIPRFVPCRPGPDGWTIDADEVAAAVTPRTAAALMMSPAMPTDAVLAAEHWTALAAALERHDGWLLYDAAMERIRFDGRPAFNPCSMPELRPRTLTIGSASKELRMIGWRVGWVVGPAAIMHDVNLVGLTNVVCQVGLAQEAVAAALGSATADVDMAHAAGVWAERSSHLVAALHAYHPVPPAGGWSMLLNTSALGIPPAEASERLFTRAAVAATPMTDWGPSGGDYLRLVFANEPVERLTDIADRFRRALG